MKSLLLTTTFVLCSFFGFSQDYKLDELKNYYYNSSTSKWEQEQTQIYDYANGGIKETNILIIDFLDSEKKYQIKKSYNPNNDISLIVNQEWDLNLSNWSTYSQVSYEYDTSKRLIKETAQLYDNTSMGYLNYSRTIYEYPNPNLVIKTLQEWDEPNNDWINEEKDEMTYTNGLLTKQISSSWIPLYSEWLLQTKDTLIYNESNLLIEWRYDNYTGINDEWETDDRNLVFYSGMLKTEVLSQSWINSKWRNESKYIYGYDDNGNEITVNYEQRDSAINLELVPHYKEEKVYSLANSLSADAFVTSNFKIYPNPSKGQFIIDLGNEYSNVTVQIYNILGQVIATSHYVSIDKIVQEITSEAGIYFVKVNSDSKEFKAQRIIKQ